MPRPQQTKHNNGADLPSVLTLDEVAQLLRLPRDKVTELVEQGSLPGRRIDDDYRFLRTAVETWLQGSSTKKTLLGLAGALKGDPHFPGILDEISKSRKAKAHRGA